MKNFALGLFVAFLMSAGISYAFQPDCPSEDSCSSNYNGRTDKWEIKEIQP